MTSTNTGARARLLAATSIFLMLVFAFAVVISSTTGPAGLQATTTDVVTNQSR